MGIILALTILLPIIMVSLLITVDTVFRQLNHIVSGQVAKGAVVVFLYFVYLFCFFSLATQLIGFVVYGYTIALFIAYFIFRNYGQFLLLVTPIFQYLSVVMISSQASIPFVLFLLVGIINFFIYLYVESLNLKRDPSIFGLQLILMTFTSLIFQGNSLKVFEYVSKVHLYIYVLIGLSVLIGCFSLYYYYQERETQRIREELIYSKKDKLTGAYNFSAFSEMITYLNKKEEGLVIAMIDLDYFKSINDMYGHLNGNKVLRDFVQLLDAHLAISLEEKQYEVYRFGGEEFAIFFYQLPREECYQVLENFRRKLSNYPIFIDEGEDIQVTFSAGVGTSLFYDNDALLTLQKADEACYRAKMKGRNRILMCTECTEQQIQMQ